MPMIYRDSIYGKLYGTCSNSNSGGEWQWREENLRRCCQVQDILKIEGGKVQNFTFDLIINRLKERNDRNVSLEKGG